LERLGIDVGRLDPDQFQSTAWHPTQPHLSTQYDNPPTEEMRRQHQESIRETDERIGPNFFKTASKKDSKKE
jgi:hypothetical protein